MLNNSHPLADNATEISNLQPSTTAQELIKLRDWILLANSSNREENASNKILDTIYERLGNILEREGIVSLCETGRFDYEIHKIVSTRCTEDPEQDDSICDIVRPGYIFKGLLIRPQEVIVYGYEKKAN
jgi:molecular chaperone GrpE (heat shock protein)